MKGRKGYPPPSPPSTTQRTGSLAHVGLGSEHMAIVVCVTITQQTTYRCVSLKSRVSPSLPLVFLPVRCVSLADEVGRKETCSDL